MRNKELIGVLETVEEYFKREKLAGFKSEGLQNSNKIKNYSSNTCKQK
ncbi:hypothetical protein [Microbulbifer sp. TRSA001]